MYSRQMHGQLYLDKHKTKLFMMVYPMGGIINIMSCPCFIIYPGFAEDNENNWYKLRICLSVSQNTLIPYWNVRKDNFYSRNYLMLLKKIWKTFNTGTLCYRLAKSWSSKNLCFEKFLSFLFSFPFRTPCLSSMENNR